MCLSTRVYVINLQIDADRLEAIRKSLADLSIPFDRVDAIDGRALSPQKVRDFVDIHPPFDWTAGELGAFLSHLKAWQLFVESGADLAVILEDDLLLSKRLPDFLAELGKSSREFDIIKIETIGCLVSIDGRATASVAGIDLHQLRSAHAGAGGYILSKQAALYLLSINSSIDDAIDAIFEPNRPTIRPLRILQAVPGLVVQHQFASSATFASRLEQDRRDRNRLRKQQMAAHRVLWMHIRRPLRQFQRTFRRIMDPIILDRRWLKVPFDTFNISRR